MGKIDNYQKIYEIIESEWLSGILKRGRRFDEDDSQLFWYVDIQDFDEYGFDKEEEEFLIDCLRQKDIVVYDRNGKEYGKYSDDELIDYYDYYDDKKNTMERLKLYRKNGDINLRNELVMENMKIVERVAKKLSSEYSVSYDELVQMGAEHLIKIIDQYDLGLTDKFTHYCYMKINRFLMKDVINMFVNNGMNSVITREYLEKKKYIENMYGQTVEENPRLMDEIIDLMHILGEDYLPPMGIEDLLEQYSVVVSGGELVVENQELIEKLHEIIGTLSERDQLIIKMRYGLDDGRKKTTEEIAKRIGRTTSRVHQKEKDIYRKLRGLLFRSFENGWKFGKMMYGDLMEHSHDTEYPEESKKSSRR